MCGCVCGVWRLYCSHIEGAPFGVGLVSVIWLGDRSRFDSTNNQNLPDTAKMAMKRIQKVF